MKRLILIAVLTLSQGMPAQWSQARVPNAPSVTSPNPALAWGWGCRGNPLCFDRHAAVPT